MFKNCKLHKNIFLHFFIIIVDCGIYAAKNSITVYLTKKTEIYLIILCSNMH